MDVVKTFFSCFHDGITGLSHPGDFTRTPPFREVQCGRSPAFDFVVVFVFLFIIFSFCHHHLFFALICSFYVSVQSYVFIIASCTVYIVCKIYLLQCRV